MATSLQLAAIDLGAESGRCILASFDGQRVTIDEVHRFPNVPVRVLDSLHWDPLRLFAEIKDGLGLCAQRAELCSLGIDTWGLDFALLGRDDELLGNPFHYRDRRSEGVMERAFQRVPAEEIFERTGIQFMPFNSLYQLLAMQGSPALECAQTFLTMPDLFNFWLSGRKACEFTNATTTQLYDTRAGDWAFSLMEGFGLPKGIFPAVVQPGTRLGTLLPSVAAELGLGAVPVIAPACHDTGSAVAAVPAGGRRYAYISSGTWSLVGAEVPAPVINPQSLAYNFTNEGGVNGTVRVLKNVMGLWLVQECRREWKRMGDEFRYAELTQMAAQAAPFGPLVDPDHPGFLAPGNMPDQVRLFCSRTGQPVPWDRSTLLRCIFESLALKYRLVIERLDSLLGQPVEVIHVIGGGSRNALLCQMTADVTGRPVVAGPFEATALGNALVQAIALGHLASLAEARQVVAASFDLPTYEPRSSSEWDEAYERFNRLLS